MYVLVALSKHPDLNPGLCHSSDLLPLCPQIAPNLGPTATTTTTF